MSANAPWYSYHQGWRATWECNFNTGKTIRASSNWTFFLWFIIMMRICVSPSIYVNTIHSFFRLRLCARMANALLCLNIHFFFFVRCPNANATHIIDVRSVLKIYEFLCVRARWLPTACRRSRDGILILRFFRKWKWAKRTESQARTRTKNDSRCSRHDPLRCEIQNRIAHRNEHSSIWYVLCSMLSCPAYKRLNGLSRIEVYTFKIGRYPCLLHLSFFFSETISSPSPLRASSSRRFVCSKVRDCGWFDLLNSVRANRIHSRQCARLAQPEIVGR